MSVRACVFGQYGDGKKRRKPNYSSVDLSEVEWEDKDDTVRLHSALHHRLHRSMWVEIFDMCLILCMWQLRNAMVNRKTGTFTMEVKKSVDKGVSEEIKIKAQKLWSHRGVPQKILPPASGLFYFVCSYVLK